MSETLQDADEAIDTFERLAQDNARLRDEIVWMRQRAERSEAQVDLLRAEVVATREVIEAAQGVINCGDPLRDPPDQEDDVAVDHSNGCLFVLSNALDAYDRQHTQNSPIRAPSANDSHAHILADVETQTRPGMPKSAWEIEGRLIYPPSTRCTCGHDYLRHNYPNDECSRCSCSLFMDETPGVSLAEIRRGTANKPENNEDQGIETPGPASALKSASGADAWSC